MRVPVTGASGFVGSHAVAALPADGHKPLLLARNPEKTRRVLADLGVIEPVSLHKTDIRDAVVVRAGLEQCDAVIHAAAEIGVTGGRCRRFGVPPAVLRGGRARRGSASGSGEYRRFAALIGTRRTSFPCEG